MEYTKVQEGVFGELFEQKMYRCDMCGEDIPKEDMGNSVRNRGKIQVNLFTNRGQIQHFCRKCSEKIVNFVGSNG